MKPESHLTFIFHAMVYAVSAVAVKEILYLPHLIPTEEAAPNVVGVFNLRGRIVRVVDLDLCFGRTPRPYAITDAVVVVESGGKLVGIIANEALEVRSIAEADMEREAAAPRPFIGGAAKADNRILTVLDAEQLLAAPPASGVPARGERTFFPHATPEERRILESRSANYLLTDEERQLLGTVPLAVAVLGGEYIAVELEHVAEFADVRDTTPVPCAPGHIAGNMNLRGNLLTLVDVRGFLNIGGSGRTGEKAVVTSANGVSAGILVDEICDVVYVNPADISPPPSAVWAEGARFVKGSAPYGGRVATVLDVQKLFTSAEFIVNAEA